MTIMYAVLSSFYYRTQYNVQQEDRVRLSDKLMMTGQSLFILLYFDYLNIL